MPKSAFKDILSCLGDHDSDVRISALIALPQIAGKSRSCSLTKVEGLLQDSIINVQMQAALTLAKFGLVEQGVPVLINQLIMASLQINFWLWKCWERSRLHHNQVRQMPFDIQPILNVLDHPSATIRKAACRALRNFNSELSVQCLIKCLYDQDSAVRHAASESLRCHGRNGDQDILEVLQSNDVHAQDAALEIIALDGTTTRNALLDYVRRESSAIRFLRLQLNRIAEGGRSTHLLRETIQNRIASHEKHLIMTVGIFSNHQAMEMVRKSMHVGDHETRAAALETLETLGNKELTREIIPLLENELPQTPGR